MNPHYNQNYTREEIDAILAKIKSCVEKNSYTISLNENRQKNIDFITVDVYTKFNVIDLPSGSRAVVISFHKRNKPIDYLFR